MSLHLVESRSFIQRSAIPPSYFAHLCDEIPAKGVPCVYSHWSVEVGHLYVGPFNIANNPDRGLW